MKVVLFFPAYYKKGEIKDTRISEQELRFAFVEEFNSYCEKNQIKLFYSIEAPTKDTYSGFTDEPIINHEKGKGRSAEFDLVIYDEDLNRECLIEFKANNASEIDHNKDFLKLNNKAEGEKDVLRYFIEIIKSYSEFDNDKNDTISSLKKKFDVTGLKKRILEVCKTDIGDYTQIRCYALKGKSSKKTRNKGEDISDKFQKKYKPQSDKREETPIQG